MQESKLKKKLLISFFLHIYMSIYFLLRLQTLPTPRVPRNVQTLMNNIRNFISHSTDNINIVRFRNAQTTNTPTMVNYT